MSEVRIGLALGGGFARGVAHAGVLRAVEESGIRLHCIAGVSAGAIAAAAFASGATAKEIGDAGTAMRFSDVARWSWSRMGLMGSSRMEGFLGRLLKQNRFEDMKIPLGVVATDLMTGSPALFRNQGAVPLAVRASCAYPGIFEPVRMDGRLLVDGAMSMEIPAALCRQMGATHVISVGLPSGQGAEPGNLLEVVNRCFRMMQARTEQEWRKESDAIIEVDVTGAEWNGFSKAGQLIEAGERAAWPVLSMAKSWVNNGPGRVAA